MPQPTLILCGSIAIDRVMNFSGQFKELINPAELSSLSISVLVDSLNTAPGGIAANIAHNAGQLGDKAVLYGSVGADADMYIDRLAKEGVDTSYVNRSNQATASFSVFTDADNNQIGGFYPGAMSDSTALTFERWQPSDIFVTLSAHDPATMRAQVQECKTRGIRLFYDPGQQVANVPAEDLKAGIAVAELMALNEYECSMLCKKISMTAEQLAQSVKVLIITRGEHGSIITGSAVPTVTEIPAATPTKVVDPVGAGDAYRAGFLHGYLRQWELAQCGKLASVVASFVVEEFGPQCDISTTKIMERYKQTFNEEITL